MIEQARKEMVMQRRTFLLGTAALLNLGRPGIAAVPINATLFKDPACGCCGVYANYLRGNGFTVEVVSTAEFAEIGRKAGVPEGLEGCHTAFVGDYVVSGHVPVDVVRKLLDERPAITGVTLAGMPAGSPGMGGDKTEPFQIYAFTKNSGEPTIYVTQ
jgi:hypothetical protein